MPREGTSPFHLRSIRSKTDGSENEFLLGDFFSSSTQMGDCMVQEATPFFRQTHDGQRGPGLRATTERFPQPLCGPS